MKANYTVEQYTVDDMLGSRIYFKLDYYSMVFNDMAMFDVLGWLGIDYLVDDFVKDQFTRLSGWQENIVFRFEGIQLESNAQNYFGFDTQDLSVFDRKLPHIRLSISGQGLDYLRSLKMYDVDVFLRDWSQVPKPAHCTRCDFAYDLVNYMPGILDQMIEHCKTKHMSDRRVRIYKGRPVKFDYKDGQQRTLYLGSPTSDQLLRVYDKRMQYTDPETGIYKVPNAYNDPASWIRFELQARNKKAQNACFNDVQDRFAMFREIYDKFCFSERRNLGHDVTSYKICDWWQNLFNWEEVEQIIQNTKFVDLFIKTPKERAEQAALRARGSALFNLTLFGSDAIRHFQEYIDQLNDDTWVSARIRSALACKLKKIGHDPRSASEGWIQQEIDGHLYICFKFTADLGGMMILPKTVKERREELEHFRRLQKSCQESFAEQGGDHP